ncbi:hypothetical protein CBR_g2804 [Chara braunii]|uniref:NFD4 C-terminal domain-containing protein n=1 Tax=Chara braunii TaxID=69332 RepID=A0A388KE78_CHABU|nr:hypothetical protein CBR_g2804 [Chara braunii]|eukprot:GBG68253.1 hypothetical protein CBR_g2804 [Chara braunii]
MPTMDSLKPASRYTNEEVEWHRLAELSTSNRPDMTVCQTLWTVDFWLIFIVMATGASTAIAAINNLSQIGRALHVNDVKFFVGLVSIWSCFGRLTGGFLPDILLKKGVPRPVSLCFSTGMISITHLVLKSGAIRLGSVMIGFCYGSYWSITPPITSEIFGLTHFAATYKTVT